MQDLYDMNYKDKDKEDAMDKPMTPLHDAAEAYNKLEVELAALKAENERLKEDFIKVGRIVMKQDADKAELLEALKKICDHEEESYLKAYDYVAEALTAIIKKHESK